MMFLSTIHRYHGLYHLVLACQPVFCHIIILHGLSSLYKSSFSCKHRQEEQGDTRLKSNLLLRRTASPAKLPFYYGWVILIVSSLGVLASIPGQTMGVSVFTDHLIAALGISRVNLSTAYLVGTLSSSLIIPYAGIFLDKKGARPTATITAVGLVLSLVFLGFSPNITDAIASILPINQVVIAFVVATIGFLGIRFCGQGVTEMVARTMLGRWFGPRRGLVAGIMGVTTAFGFSYAPQPLQALVTRYGWVGALQLIALLLTVIYLPIVLLFYRSDPESVGLKVEEGLPLRTSIKTTLNQDSDIEYTVKEAKRQIRYWVMMVSMGFWTLFNTAFTFHIVSIHAEIGVSVDQAVKIFLPISFISVAAQFIGSYLSDRIRIKWLFMAFTTSVMLSSIAIFLLGSSFGTLLLILGYGTANGLFSMLNVVAWPKLYGRKHLGAISGFAMSILVAGSALGPWLFSIVQTITGTYTTMGIIGTMASLILLGITAILPFSKPISQP
jgi:MFS transporter, OFA family, oxalate/formate antiporter